jgi:hypothetical protein
MSALKVTWKTAKWYLIVIAIIVHICFMISSYRGTPSVQNASKKMEIMKADMDALLKQGNSVLSRREMVNVGGATISVTVSDKRFTDDSVKKYNDFLIYEKWSRINNTDYRFCKNGVLLLISSSSPVSPNVFLGMTYNKSSIRECENKNAQVPKA